MDKLALSAAELALVKRILKEHVAPGTKVLAFGSRVRGTWRASSDLDLALVTKCPLDISTRSKLEFGFSESDLPFRVDVVDMSTVEPAFAAVIEREGVVVTID
jgi:predicted nucleotidyltransferase